MTDRLVVIINPLAGGRGAAAIARETALVALVSREQRLATEVVVTSGPGHARALAATAVAAGARLICAWGGDGTVNEVMSALAGGPATLAIVPVGSGNGLARELGIPPRPRAALAAALTGQDRVIDVGAFDGRLFVNVAGVGLDARVARRFADGGAAGRGFRRYVAVTAREWLAASPDAHTVTVDGSPLREPTLFIAIANSRQYGNGVLVDPSARLDDGVLDVVAVRYRRPLPALLQVPRIFAGGIASLPGVSVRRGTHVVIETAQPVACHVDGEPFIGGPSIEVRVRPAALRVRVPPTR